MKILAFADTHSDMAAVEKLASRAKSEGVDATLCAGDISEFGDKIGKIFEKLDVGVPMIYIPGNHEGEGKDLSEKHGYVKNIHKKTLCNEGILFLGCGGGGFTKTFPLFEHLMDKFRKAVKKHDGPTVLVTHAPPFKTKLDMLHKTHLGAEPVRSFIKSAKPTYAISGHIHETAGTEAKLGKTKLVNPGKKGVVIEV